MKAAIIAAGHGERLKRGGIAVPKPLIPIGNETLIARVIRAAGHVKATSVGCIVNGLNPAVDDYLRNSSWPIPVELVVRTTESSMESLFALAPLLQNEPFLLFTVDTIFEFSALEKFLDEARRIEGDGALAVTQFVDDEKPLWARLDNHRRIVAFAEKAQPCPYVTAGFYYFKPNIFSMADVARAKRLSALRQFLGLLLEGGFTFFGIPVSKTVDVDCPEDIEKARRYLEEIGG
ncbi:MAG TPA: sugar phosphate nucleotidyltransferase [Thermodesulfobacteriota bacterium]|jgi:NDP-sugar pyrophosphorylase family protein|nr:sugar phosphate nucleotidyltransferase [Thermodesulfobacteriota bacterium]